jgi:glutamate dehydrogenase/leucine dehydrogenase
VYGTITERDILYCPDFAINSGGVICVAAERMEGGPKREWIENKVAGIYDTTARVLDESKRRGRFTEEVAVELAKERITEAKRHARR